MPARAPWLLQMKENACRFMLFCILQPCNCGELANSCIACFAVLYLGVFAVLQFAVLHFAVLHVVWLNATVLHVALLHVPELHFAVLYYPALHVLYRVASCRVAFYCVAC